MNHLGFRNKWSITLWQINVSYFVILNPIITKFTSKSGTNDEFPSPTESLH